MVKVLIFGTGGVGIIYAYIAHKGGADVTVVCRSNYDATRENGLTIESQLWGLVKFHPQKVVRSIPEAAATAKEEEGYDFILVCSKAFPGTAQLIAEAVSEHTAIVRTIPSLYFATRIERTVALATKNFAFHEY